MGPLGVAEPAAGRTRPSLLAATLTSAGPVTSGIGVRMALEPGRGRTAVPVRSALAGTVVAIAALVAAAVFGASLAGLVGTPGRYGQNWDAELSTGFAAVPASLGAKVLSTVPGIAGYTEGNSGQLTIDGQLVPAIGVDPPPAAPVRAMTAATSRCWPAGRPTARTRSRSARRRCAPSTRGSARPCGSPSTWRRESSGRAPSGRCGSSASPFSPTSACQDLSDTDLGNGAVVPAALLTTTQANTGCVQGVHLLRLLPAPLPRRAPTRPPRTTRLLAAAAAVGCPFGACTVTSRPAARRDQGLCRGQRHPARTRPGARGARRRHRGARPAHRGAPPPPGHGGAQDPGVHQVPSPGRGRLGGHRAGRRRAAHRHPGRRRRRPGGPGRCSPTRPGSPARPPSRCRWCCSRSRSPSRSPTSSPPGPAGPPPGCGPRSSCEPSSGHDGHRSGSRCAPTCAATGGPCSASCCCSGWLAAWC